MNTLIILGLAAAVMLAALGSLRTAPVPPPQIIYVQVEPRNAGEGTGCLPLLVLIGVILLAMVLG